MILDGVGASLVERIDFGKIVTDLVNGQGLKGNVGADGKKAFAMHPQVQKANAGNDLMGAPLELIQHPVCIGKIAGFTIDFPLQKDQGVGPQHNGIGNFLGDDAGFAMGIELADFPGRQMLRGQFRGVTGDDLEFRGQLTQEIGAAGRGRCQDQ